MRSTRCCKDALLTCSSIKLPPDLLVFSKASVLSVDRPTRNPQWIRPRLAERITILHQGNGTVNSHSTV